MADITRTDNDVSHDFISSNLMVIAIDPDTGKIVNINDDNVISRKKKKYKCLWTGYDVIPRKGEKNAWHFAYCNSEHNTLQHKNKNETQLHEEAKRIAAEIAMVNFQLPKYKLDKYTYQQETSIAFEKCEIEKGLYDIESNVIIPDIIAWYKGESFAIEIAATHFIDGDKEVKIRNHNLPTIEINVSSLLKKYRKGKLTEKDIYDCIRDSIHTSWIFHRKSDLFKSDYDRIIDAKDFSQKEMVQYDRIIDDWTTDKLSAKKESLVNAKSELESSGVIDKDRHNCLNKDGVIPSAIKLNSIEKMLKMINEKISSIPNGCKSKKEFDKRESLEKENQDLKRKRLLSIKKSGNVPIRELTSSEVKELESWIKYKKEYTLHDLMQLRNHLLSAINDDAYSDRYSLRNKMLKATKDIILDKTMNTNKVLA